MLLENKGSPGPAFCPLPEVRVLPPFPGDAGSSQGQPARPLKAKSPVLGVSVLLPTHTPHTPSARTSWRPHRRDQKLRPDPGRTAPERTFAKKSIAALVQTSPKGVERGLFFSRPDFENSSPGSNCRSPGFGIAPGGSDFGQFDCLGRAGRTGEGYKVQRPCASGPPDWPLPRTKRPPWACPYPVGTLCTGRGRRRGRIPSASAGMGEQTRQFPRAGLPRRTPRGQEGAGTA